MFVRLRNIMNTLQAISKFIIPSLFLLLPFTANSQINIYPVQDFNFGNFYPNNAGGTISISTEGSRSSTGDIVLLNSGLPVSQAIFEIEAPLNSRFSMNYSNSVLTNGTGGSMSLEITGSNPASVFTHTAVSPDRSTIYFSGKLTVGNLISSPPGDYHGTVSITFNYE